MIAVALLAALAAGCYREDNTPPPPPTPVRVVYNATNAADEAHFDLWREHFEAARPGWTLQAVSVSDGQSRAYYRAAAAGGTLPELIYVSDQLPFLVAGKMLQPLPESFYTGVSLPVPGVYRGDRWASWQVQRVIGLAVNRDLWRQAGVDRMPTDINSLIAALAKIRAFMKVSGLSDKGFVPLACGVGDWSARMPLELMICVDLYDNQADIPSWTARRTRREVTFVTSQRAQVVLESLVKLLGAAVDPSQAVQLNHRHQRELFVSGKAAAWFTGSWTGREMADAKASFDAVLYPMPSATGRRPTYVSTDTVAAGWAISSSATGEAHAAAMTALETLYTSEVYQAYLNATGGFGRAADNDAASPRSEHAPANAFYENTRILLDKYGAVGGCHRDPDAPFPPAVTAALGKVVRDALTAQAKGKQPAIPAVLAELDAQWEQAVDPAPPAP